MSALDLLDRLEQVTGGKGRWMACCPAHQDKSPSLAITEVDDRVLVYCFAGCETSDITAAIGLNVADLFYLDSGHTAPTKRTTKIAGCLILLLTRHKTNNDGANQAYGDSL